MSDQDSKKIKPLSRRDFLKLLGAGGTAVASSPGAAVISSVAA